jgi:hypothetical protein
VQIWLGGSPNQTRLAKVFVERMKVRDLEATLEPLFAAYKARRQTPVSAHCPRGSPQPTHPTHPLAPAYHTPTPPSLSAPVTRLDLMKVCSADVFTEFGRLVVVFKSTSTTCWLYVRVSSKVMHALSQDVAYVEF